MQARTVTPLLVCCLILSSSLIATASSIHKHDKSSRTSEPDISNFGKINNHYYRGAQPKDDEYSQLAALGVKTVIDLRDNAKDYAKVSAERVGLRYINLPMSDKSYPPADIANRFLGIVTNPDNWPVYVHCAGGRHRTGAMTAVYRIAIDGWDADRAYREMKEYDYYSRWGHGDMKDFVYDFYRDQARRPSSSVQTISGFPPQ